MTSRGGRARPLPYSRQWIDPADIREVARILRSDWITQGPTVREFEERFAKYCGARHAVSFSSGTAALHGCCFAAGLGAGDEALVPPVTFVATANAVLYVGATPRFCDVESDTATMDPKAFEAAITKRTRAVIPVDYAGHPCDLPAIRRIARRRGLVVIEDAAHALGARCRGQRVGTLADLTVFSFHPVKHITTGEGGMVTTDDEALARRLRMFSSHGITKDPAELEHNEGPWYYEMQQLGYNYRITDFQCALGIAQLAKVEEFIRVRRARAAQYDRLLKELPEVSGAAVRPWARHSYQLYPIRLRAGSRPRRAVVEELRARGIGVQVHYIPVHLQPYYRKRFGTRKGQYPRAEAFYSSEISLPLFPRMRESDVRRVVRTLKDVLRSRGS
ncbi:MAG: UDP-4-amino-4,6-dideoxy-N-acetyl-beta-L-altrosamine transaminase [Planctomycetes bacterium]|nr:UDP-4-amino-4,6-dideoxy-N-acetyl-beta-L-altrosamine transaminase [Planctomycetota bacterium]